MARRNQNLAGLAALGALGYMLRDKGAPVEDRVGVDVVRTPDVERMLYPDESSGTGEYAPAAPVVSDTRSITSSAPAAPAMMSQEEMTRRRLAGGPRGRTESVPTRVAGQGGPRGVLYSPTDTGDETARLARRSPGTALDRIPTDAGRYAPVSGERVTGSETTRNLSNIMNATAGLSVPGFVPQITQRQFNARAAARRAAGDLTPAEVEAARQRIADAAITGGMKKGGKVKAKAKKMASGGMTKSSVSKRADGIATKGKTKCKMY